MHKVLVLGLRLKNKQTRKPEQVELGKIFYINNLPRYSYVFLLFYASGHENCVTSLFSSPGFISTCMCLFKVIIII